MTTVSVAGGSPLVQELNGVLISTLLASQSPDPSHTSTQRHRTPSTSRARIMSRYNFTDQSHIIFGAQKILSFSAKMQVVQAVGKVFMSTDPEAADRSMQVP